jgi:hypothetical protein
MQDRHGVVVEVLPPPGRKLLENLLRLLVPCPPEVPGESMKTGGEFGNFRSSGGGGSGGHRLNGIVRNAKRAPLNKRTKAAVKLFFQKKQPLPNGISL